MQVFAFGHSITQGFWDCEGGWVQRLRKFLDEKSLENPEKYYFEVYNLGVSGDDTRQLLDRFEDELEARLWEEDGTTIILQVGANDIIRLREENEIAVPEEEFEENLGELIALAREHADSVLLVGEAYTTIDGPIPWAEQKELSDERLERYVEMQRKVCREENVPYVDLRSMYSKEEWSEMLEDGSHPDREGHKVIYKSVLDRLKQEGMLGL
ncbi:MAG: SGNH/GDSL hydrolase family protein [Candidatus Nanohaloarchaea archaeon]